MSRFLLPRDRAVQAGAGTGKTHALVTQYLHLCAGLSAHGKALEPRQIAALTFTEKAAGEMLERIRQRVQRLLRALGEGEGEAARRAEPELYRSAEALRRPAPDQAHWERVLERLGAAQVGTFHSFAAGLLRRHPAESGVDPDFALLDEDSALDLELEATERAVLAALDGAAGARAAEDAALLLAEYGFRAPGVGKGLVELLARVRARRAEEGLGPSGLACGYDEEAIAAGFAEAAGEVLAGLQRLGVLADLLGEKSAPLARELGASAALLREILQDVRAVPRALPQLDAMLPALGRLRGQRGDRAAQEALAEAKARLRRGRRDLEAVHASLLGAPLAHAFERLLGAAWRAYDEAKAQRRALDFTDLLRRARDLLRDHAPVRAALRERLAVVLVDECQDTNPLQAELLTLLCGASRERGAEGPGRLYIVGDRKQSIYEFRGADVATFQGLAGDIAEAGGDTETLGTSRRSRPGVLALINALFSRVMQPPPGGSLDATLCPPAASAPPAAPLAGPAPEARWPAWIIRWDPERDPLLPLREEGEGGPAAELLTVAAGDGPEGGAAAASDPIEREAQLLARHVLALRDEGRRFGDMAVLLRRFTHLDRYLLALRQAAIPHYVVRGRGFYQAQEVRDLCAALSLLDDPDDTLQLVALLRSPLCGVSDETLARLHLGGCLGLRVLWRRDPPWPEDLPAGEAARLARILRILLRLSERGDRLGPAACVRALLEGTDLCAVLLAGPEGEQRTANLELLAQRAQQFEEGGGGLRAFIRWLRVLSDPALPGESLTPQAQIASEQDDVVRVMTVHQAKGLEFPVVLLPGCAQRERTEVDALGYDRDVGLGLLLRRGGERLPTLPALRMQRLRRLRSEAESQRLFYVAVTRARDRVVFLGESRRTGARGTWRGHLDALLASPDAGVLEVRALPPGLPAPSPNPPGPGGPASTGAATDDGALPEAVRRCYEAPPAAAGALELPLEAAVDLSLCPRRFHLRHAALLPEPGDAPAEETRGRAARLLQGRAFREILAEASPRYGVPFRLRAGALLLRGEIGVLLQHPDGAVTLLDLRDGRAPAGAEPEGEALRRAALGHVALHLARGARARVGLCYLREADPAPRLHEADAEASAAALQRLAAAAPRWAAACATGPAPIEEPRCAALGCGYRARCHGAAAQAALQ